MIDLYDTFISYLEDLKPTHFLIFLHHNADPDAICAAKIFGYLFQSLDKNHNYSIYSDDINLTATRIMEEFDIRVHNDLPEIDNGTNYVLVTVDTANLSQLGKYQSWISQQQFDLLVIDHHDTSLLAEDAKASIVVTETASTCVLADRALQAAGVKVSPDIATLVLSGHMYDSRRMLFGTSSTIMHRFAELIDLGGDFELANDLLQNDMGHGERIARLKSAKRLHYTSKDQVIIVTSKVGAFEASSARAMLSLGADISLILAPKGAELRGSARADPNLINIGEIMSDLASEFGGTGGGHAAAAGMNIKPNPTKKIQTSIMKRFSELVSEKLQATD